MNEVILCGRLTKDPEMRYFSGPEQKAVARYTLAVDRRSRKKGGQQEQAQTADFISCVTFGNGAELAEKYLRQGKKVLVRGHIQTGSYTNRDGQRIFTTDVVVDDCEFVESKAQENQSAPAGGDDFLNIPPDQGDGLPFS